VSPAEYIQLKAFARYDGLTLAALWVASFACYIIGLSSPLWSIVGITLAVASPFFVARRLRLFRDGAREGIISFMRGWAFVVFVFFYASLLFALAQYAYFAFLDHGYLSQAITGLFDNEQTLQIINQNGMGDMLRESMNEFQRMRPIDIALNMLTTNIMIGMLLGLPIAAVMKRTTGNANQKNV
jgi:hypothetical protein